jgi:hypothetical protein
VICEADVDDFQDINEVLVQRNFVLYDATQLQRLSDGTLGWFHPVYVNRALDHVRPGQFREPQRSRDPHSSGTALCNLEIQRGASRPPARAANARTNRPELIDACVGWRFTSLARGSPLRACA